MKTEKCPHCRGGKQYAPDELLPYDCTSCNGTGIAGNPAWTLLCFIFCAFAVSWIVYQILIGIYD